MKETIIKKIIEYFENNEEVFNACIEELDCYNGYLNDNRYYYMEELNELYNGTEPIEILQRAYFGRDDDTWTTDASGNKTHGEFNPNREYFYFNGYGNLVSSDYKDYSAFLDTYAVEEMNENRSYIDSIDSNEELSALFDESDTDPDEEAFNEFCENHDCDTCKYCECKNTHECFEQFIKDNAKGE